MNDVSNAWIANRIAKPYFLTLSMANELDNAMDDWQVLKQSGNPYIERIQAMKNIVMQWYSFYSARNRLKQLVAPFGTPPSVCLVEVMTEDFMEQICEIMCTENTPHYHFRVPRN